MTRAERISELVAELDQENTNDADEAQFELTEDFGAEALEPLLEAAPGFSDYGRLCAIEVFESIGDRRAAPVLIPWLKSSNNVVRDWSAGALGRIGASEAVPHLLEAWEATKTRGTPPDWTEPVSIRDALATLGARRVVTPSTVAQLAIEDDVLAPAWPAAALPHVLHLLADARQVVLFFSYWTRRPEYAPTAWYGITEAGATMDLDWNQPWHTVVDESRRQATATAEAEAPTIPSSTVVTIEWIDHTDVHPR